MLDKREIMLNETDSLRELKLTEEAIFNEYAYACVCVERKSVRDFLFSELKTIAQDMEILTR